MNRTRKNLKKLLVILFFFIYTAGIGGAQTALAAAFRVIYNNDNIGELDSCG